MHKDCLVTKASKIKLCYWKVLSAEITKDNILLKYVIHVKQFWKCLISCIPACFNHFFFFLLLCDIYLLGIFWISYIIGSKQDDNRYSQCSTRPIPWQMPYMLILTKLWIETALVRAFVKIAGERFLYLSRLISSLLTPDKSGGF